MTRAVKLGLVAAAALATVGLPAAVSLQGKAAGPATMPASAVDAPAAGRHEVAVLAGGCFWGVEAVYEHVKGVIDVRSGYAGGDPRSANYPAVSAGDTRHAEAVRIVFDPRIVGYGQLLRIFFAVAHDPTQLNRQGPDVGPQYRSAIFPQTPAQQKVARAYVAELGKSRAFGRPIATRIEGGRFFDAEPYHQDFMARNPAHPYIIVHDRPKLAALQRRFPAYWKS